MSGPAARARLLAAVAALASVPVSGAAQPPPPTAAAMRTLTREAAAGAGGDGAALVLALDRRVRERWGDFESFPITIVRREDITVFLETPYMAYRRRVIDRLRVRAPLSAVPWVDTAVVIVSPGRLDAPDITAIVVERGGTPVPPAKNLLRPMTFTSGAGGSAVLHAGEVHVPISAFAPGAPVTVAAVPAEGAPFVLALDDARLRQLK